jgi:mutator protein MutT
MKDYESDHPKTTKRAAGIIIKDDQILLMHRFNKGREYYVFPGGSVENGESVEEAAIREMKEELGLDVKLGELFFEIFLKNDFDWGRTSYFFLVESFTGKVALGGPEKEVMNDKNRYYPYWSKLEDLRKMTNLYPSELREKLIEYLAKK